jgi:hypothetical protein
MSTWEWDTIPDDDPILSVAVTTALAALDGETHDRAAAELAEHWHTSRAMREWIAVRRVALFWRRPLAEQVRDQAVRRSLVGDPTAGVWFAWAEAAAGRL